MASVEHEGEDLIGYLRTPDLKLDPPANAVELRGFYAAQKLLRDLLDGLEGGLLGIGYERTVETVSHEADDGGFHVRPTGAQVLTLRVNDPRLRAQCIDAVGGRKVLDDGPRPSWLMPEAE